MFLKKHISLVQNLQIPFSQRPGFSCVATSRTLGVPQSFSSQDSWSWPSWGSWWPRCLCTLNKICKESLIVSVSSSSRFAFSSSHPMMLFLPSSKNASFSSAKLPIILIEPLPTQLLVLLHTFPFLHYNLASMLVLFGKPWGYEDHSFISCWSSICPFFQPTHLWCLWAQWCQITFWVMQQSLLSLHYFSCFVATSWIAMISPYIGGGWTRSPLWHTHTKGFWWTSTRHRILLE